MRSLLTLCSLLVVFAAGALGEDECAPPTPGQKHVHPGECCKITTLPSSMKTAVHKCREKYPMGKPPGPRPTGPPPSGPPPTPSIEMRQAHACTEECIFSEEGLLTADKTLDQAAIKAYFSADPALAGVTSAAVDKCFASYQADVDPSLECKSGAHEFRHCFFKETFINCPSALWTTSAECEDLKAKFAKCPKMPLKMGGPMRPPKV